jgi:hypothetical protein
MHGWKAHISVPVLYNAVFVKIKSINRLLSWDFTVVPKLITLTKLNYFLVLHWFNSVHYAKDFPNFLSNSIKNDIVPILMMAEMTTHCGQTEMPQP